MLKNALQFVWERAVANWYIKNEWEDIASIAKNLASIEKVEKKDLIQKNAWVAEGLHTWNTNFWADIVRSNIYKDIWNEMIVKWSKLLPLLPWNHWEINAPSATVWILWDSRKFKKWAEYTGWLITWGLQGTSGFATWKVTIAPKKYDIAIPVSIEELQYTTVENLLEKVRTKIFEWAAETIDAVIINWDTQATTSWTWNVNHKDAWTPVALDTTSYYLNNDNWIRKLWVANTIVWGSRAMDRSVYTAMYRKIWKFYARPDKLLWIHSTGTAISARTIQYWSNQVRSEDQAWISESIEGIKAIVHFDMPINVDVTWYVAQGTTAAAANVRSTFTLIYTPAVQHAMGAPMRVIVHENSWGFLFDVSIWFGFTIVNWEAETDKTIATAVVLQD